jgi:hypothetical protein
MHYAKAVSPLVTALTVVVLATEAIATPEEDAKEVRRRHRTSEILAAMDSPRVEGKSWIESHMALRKGVGVVYRYQVETDDEEKLIFSVGGPVLKKKLLGLQFEVRF